MRYFTITFVKRPSGQIDEATQTLSKLRNNDVIEANVILDFKDKKILKCRMSEGNLPVDWDTVVSYYEKYYDEVFKQLAHANIKDDK